VEAQRSGVKRAAALTAVVGLVGAVMIAPTGVVAQESAPARAATGKAKPAVIRTDAGIVRKLPSLSGGLIATAKGVVLGGTDREAAADAANPQDVEQLRAERDTLGCGKRNSAEINIRVNQDCTFRRQAETIIKLNPTDSNNVIAGFNDSRIGYNHCGFAYSFNGGKNWGDGQPPFFQRENHPENDVPNPGVNPNKNTTTGKKGTNHTYDAASDPAVTFDADGRAFFSCVLFDVHTDASGILVTQSPQGAGGSFYNNVATGATNSKANRRYVVVEDNDITVAHDKEFIIADAFPSSPNRNNVYVTWTIFFYTPAGDQLRSPIYGSMSTDHAVTWSTPQEISGVAPGLCFLGNVPDATQPANACNQDQGSDPQVLPNGDLVVVFNNGNTGAHNVNGQQLAVVCHPKGDSGAGTAKLNCGTPTKVGDDIVQDKNGNFEPQCNFGRGAEECIPGPWIRTNDFPRTAMTWSGAVFATWQDYRSGQFDVQLSMSTDGGKTWQEAAKPVNPSPNLDHYMPAIDVAEDDHVAISYYRSGRVPNENRPPLHLDCDQPSPDFPPGCFQPGDPGVQQQLSNYFLAGGFEVNTPYKHRRVSPDFPPPDGNQAGFNGDYSGIVTFDHIAMPIWSDTRNGALETFPDQGVVHDEDVFTDRIPIPFP
jgi:hypothetical protein